MCLPKNTKNKYEWHERSHKLKFKKSGQIRVIPYVPIKMVNLKWNTTWNHCPIGLFKCIQTGNQPNTIKLVFNNLGSCHPLNSCRAKAWKTFITKEQHCKFKLLKIQTDSMQFSSANVKRKNLDAIILTYLRYILTNLSSLAYRSFLWKWWINRSNNCFSSMPVPIGKFCSVQMMYLKRKFQWMHWIWLARNEP